MLVTGGRYDSVFLSSTELLVGTAPAWVFTGELPSPRDGLRGAYLDNEILMTGVNGYDNIKTILLKKSIFTLLT